MKVDPQLQANEVNASVKNSNNVNPEKVPLTWKIWKKKRYIVALMTLFGMFVNYCIRTIMSVAVVAMTESKAVQHNDGIVTTEQDFSWTSKEKGLLLSSLFYGYLSTQLMSGYLTCKFSGSMIYSIGLGIASLLTVLTPPIARYGLEALIIVRILEGCFEGCAFAAVLGVYKKWVPPAERATIMSFSLIGSQMGNIAAMLGGWVLAQHYGWQYIFYTFGGIGLLWYISWIIVVRECPSQDRFMSDDERRYILESLRSAAETERAPVPWKAILTSAPVWAIACAIMAESWGAFTMLTSLPLFLKDTMDFNIQASGLLSSAPYISVSIALPIAGWFADYLKSKKKYPATQIRKWYVSGGFALHAILFILVAYLMQPTVSLICIVIAVTFGVTSFTAIFVCCIELAPPFASLIFGIGNSFGTLSGIISPLLTGYIVQNSEVSEWRIVFYVAAAFYVFGATVFYLFGTAEQQRWATVGTSTKCAPNTENDTM